jgi:hypothetical protein
MREKIAVFPLLLSICAGLFSCNFEGSELGNNWLKGSTRTVVIDTCTVQLSTVLVDSVATSGGRHILAGAFRSEVYGESRLTPYLTFSMANFTKPSDPSDRPRLRFDSLTLMLPYAPVYNGDTTRRMTLGVHRLTDRVKLGDNGRLYSHSRFPYSPEPLTSVTFAPRPTSGRTLEVRLPDELGREFLAKFQSEATEMENNENFRRYFSGLVLEAGEDCQAQIAFAGPSADTLARMRLYYTEIGQMPIEHTLDFPLDKSLLFHAVDVDRTGTIYEGLSPQNSRIPSSQTGNMALFQSLAGCYPLIEFPYLDEIRALGEHDYVVTAQLYIYPLAGSYDGTTHTQLPDSMLLHYLPVIDDPTSALPGATYPGGTMHYDTQYPANTWYGYDVTSFISNQLDARENQRNVLQLIGHNYGYLPEALLIGNQRNGDQNVRLHITYSLYNE